MRRQCRCFPGSAAFSPALCSGERPVRSPPRAQRGVGRLGLDLLLGLVFVLFCFVLFLEASLLWQSRSSGLKIAAGGC